MTDKLMHYISLYRKSNMYTIWDAYKHPSKRKVQAYYDCLMEMRSVNGSDFRILYKNSQFFAIAWRYWDKGNCIRVRTKTESYCGRMEA